MVIKLRLLATAFVLNLITFNAYSNQVDQAVGDSLTIAEVEVNASMLAGKLKRIAGSISVLTDQQIQTFDKLIIKEQLNSLPGVYMHSGTYNTNRIVIRGIGSRTPYSSNRVKAYLNDIPLTNGDGVTTLEDITVSRIGRIEIMKGPNSALYGSGLGGTIKLMTNASDAIFDGQLRYGSFNTIQAGVESSFKVANTAIAASLHQFHSEGFRENNSYDRSSGFLTIHKKWDRTSILFTGLALTMDAQIPSSISWNDFQSHPEKAASNWLAAKGREENKRLLSGLTINHRFSETTTTKTTLFAGATKAFEHRPFNDLSDQSNNYGIRSRVQVHHSRSDLIAGVELYSEQYNWSTSLENNGTVDTLSKVVENRKYANVFMLSSYRMNAKLMLTGGLNLNRLNYVYSNKESADDAYSYPYILSPRLGFNYEASPSINYYGSVGHGFSAPSLEETLMPDGVKNTDLKPETGWMTEIGLRLSSSTKRWYFDASLYNIAIQNMLVTKRISEEDFMGINAGKTNHTGVELQTSYAVFSSKVFPGSLFLNASFTVSRNRFINFEDNGSNYSGNELPGIPAQMIFMGMTWEPFKEMTVNLHQSYFGKQFLNDANNGSYNGYYLANLNGKYQYSISEKFTFLFSAGMNNLFNSNYASMILVNAPAFGGNEPRYYYPGQPRNIYFAFAISF